MDLAYDRIDDCSLGFKLVVLGDSNRCVVLRVKGHLERLLTFLGENPIGYCLGGLFYIVWFSKLSYTENAIPTSPAESDGLLTPTDPRTSLVFFSKKSQTHHATSPRLITQALHNCGKEVVHYGQDLKRVWEPET